MVISPDKGTTCLPAWDAAPPGPQIFLYALFLWLFSTCQACFSVNFQPCLVFQDLCKGVSFLSRDLVDKVMGDCPCRLWVVFLSSFFPQMNACTCLSLFLREANLSNNSVPLKTAPWFLCWSGSDGGRVDFERSSLVRNSLWYSLESVVDIFRHTTGSASPFNPFL